MTKTIPDKWILCALKDGGYKLFASWKEAWQMNSGIAWVYNDDQYFNIHGFTGSLYMCHKDRYGVYGDYADSILNIAEQTGRLKRIESYKQALSIIDNL